MISGIYCFENIINKKKYIGQAKDIYDRKNSHLSALKSKRYNDSKCFQMAWDKYGEENFKFYIIEECDVTLLDEREIFWIKGLSSHVSEHGYNIQWGGDSFMRGLKHSKSHKEKISKSLMFHSVSNKTRYKISKANKGKPSLLKGIPKTEEHKLKLSKANTGRIHSEEAKRKISKNNARTKLKEKDVLEILNLLYNKNLTGKTIAEKYNVNPSVISEIKHGKSRSFAYGKFISNAKGGDYDICCYRK
jgi:group I intron endonuclease